jgi:hypothetical protein
LLQSSPSKIPANTTDKSNQTRRTGTGAQQEAVLVGGGQKLAANQSKEIRKVIRQILNYMSILIRFND